MPYTLVHCDGCGHCDDLHSPMASDAPELAASRKLFEMYLTKWLA